MKTGAVLFAFIGCCVLLHAEEKSFPDLPVIEALEINAEMKETIAKLIQQLGDAEFTVRVQAEEKLRTLGGAAIKQLRTAQAETTDVQIRATTAKLLVELQTEVWEGYYYYSLENFEEAIAKNTSRVRFWFRVNRKADGAFTAKADEAATLGPSTIKGTVDRASGEFSFEKSYVSQSANWKYEGKWSAERQRVEGTYGPGSGGFVLYPRKLRDEEAKRFDQAQAE